MLSASKVSINFEQFVFKPLRLKNKSFIVNMKIIADTAYILSLFDDDLANIDLSLKRCNSASRWATEVPKKGKSSKFNFQDDGHINSGPSVHI